MAIAPTVTVESALREEVREELRKVMDLDALVEPDAVEAERIREVVRSLVEAASHRAAAVGDGPIADRDGLAQRLVDEILGLGPLQPLLDDPAIEEIIVNGPHRVFAIQHGRKRLTDVFFEDDAELLRIVRRAVGSLGRRLDETSPLVDARLPDGSRLNAVIPPLTSRWTHVTVRKFLLRARTLDDLVALGTLSPEAATFLEAAVQAGLNMLISGGTGSGKTTCLNALGASIAGGEERLVTIEETGELQLESMLPDCVALQSRLPNIEGVGAFLIRSLVKNALRMRPTRIVVGEVRGAEALDMLSAMNSGHDGSMCTIHANGPRQALSKLRMYAMMADVETCRLWGAHISFDDQPDSDPRLLTLSLSRHPRLELEPVTIRRQTASRSSARQPDPEPVPTAPQNRHGGANGNGHRHEAPFELLELPPLHSAPTQDQVDDEPEPELPAEDDTGAPPIAAPASLTPLSRQCALPMTDEGEEPVAASAGPLFKVRCFGSFRVEASEGEVSGWTIQKARELLAFLLAHGGAPVLRETVAEALWPEGDLDQVSHQLSNAAYYLRRTLASAVAEVDNRVLVTANQRYHLRSGLFRVDVDAFDAHVARAEKLQGYEALVEYERALAIYTGDFMGDEAFEWAEVYRRDYQKRFVTAAHRAARLAFDSRDPKLAICFYDAILARDPIDEEAVRGIMRSHAALGDTNAVRRTYKALTTALRRELEDDAAEPLPETKALLAGLMSSSAASSSIGDQSRSARA